MATPIIDDIEHVGSLLTRKVWMDVVSNAVDFLPKRVLLSPPEDVEQFIFRGECFAPIGIPHNNIVQVIASIAFGLIFFLPFLLGLLAFTLIPGQLQGSLDAFPVVSPAFVEYFLHRGVGNFIFAEPYQVVVLRKTDSTSTSRVK